ncbi:nucleotidyltransferase family protein [Ottowia sp. VDI28]|uniref:nucleotidyltransferase family protein n=1 Tax=Ottowia sp. VDI28 TaxID=3133968 RepID=UPI003C309E75
MPSTPGSLLPVYRAAIQDAVCRHHVANPRIFGSVLEGSDTATSDLDILVDALPETTLFDLGALRFELEQLLGISVDVLTPQDLSSEFRAEVLARARPL